MGHRHSRSEHLTAAVAVATEDGLSSLSFGRVAARLGTSDRMVVYYFPSKADLVAAVVSSLGQELQALLERAFGSDPLPVDAMLRRAWPVLAAPASDPVFRVFFEAVGLASAGREPYSSLARSLIDGWVDWLEPRVAAADAAGRRRGALAVMASLDGLLLLRATSGPRAANDAARALGVLDERVGPAGEA